jgi:hypothetical protein
VWTFVASVPEGVVQEEEEEEMLASKRETSRYGVVFGEAQAEGRSEQKPSEDAVTSRLEEDEFWTVFESFRATPTYLWIRPNSESTLTQSSGATEQIVILTEGVQSEDDDGPLLQRRRAFSAPLLPPAPNLTQLDSLIV